MADVEQHQRTQTKYAPEIIGEMSDEEFLETLKKYAEDRASFGKAIVLRAAAEIERLEEEVHCPNCPHPISDHNDNGCNSPWRCDCGYVDYQIRDANKKPTTSSGDALCQHFPNVLNGLRPSTFEPFSVCLACGDTGKPLERSEQGFGSIEWRGKPFRATQLATAIEALRKYGKHSTVKVTTDDGRELDAPCMLKGGDPCRCGFTAALTSLEGERKP